jgi:CysZ protein
MIQAFFLALGQLFDRRVAAVFLKSLALTLVLFAVVSVGIWLGMRGLVHSIAAWLGNASWLSDLADILTIVLVLVAHWLMFRAIAIAVIGIFGDEVVEAVEARHYPDAHAQVRHVPFVRSLRMGLRSGLRAIAYNILFLPIYLLANVLAPIVFFLLNSWLLGRDLGEMVAVRHMPEADLPAWQKRTRMKRLGIGAVTTGLLLIPVVNFLAPVLGAAMAAHAFHLRRSR